MKVEVKQVEKKFEPIELVITIESEEELCDMWHRMNLNSRQVNNNSEGLKHKANDDQDYLFDKLDKLVEDFNLTIL